MNTFERDPNKRRVKPVGPAEQCLLDFDLGESSDDSDFRIEDCKDSEDDSLDSDEDAKASDNSSNQLVDSDNASDISETENNIENLDSLEKKNLTIGKVLQIANQKKFDPKQLLLFKDKTKLVICSGCLGDRSDDANEIVECDGCGVTVHEGCYGVSDTASVSSTVSSCSTEPWFCEACRAGVTNPSCELCPNSGGIFKETDVGKWVHLVCALYIPGVAFGEVDKLSSVTLFEMPYNKWGAKACSLCEEQRFARTGVCIGCDAGMCKTYFHVTCAQREGFLSEANSEEVDQADPYYAHCKMHSDKALVKRRRRNWLVLKLATEIRNAERKAANSQEGNENVDQTRNQRKLAKYRNKYLQIKSARKPPWVPTQKMPRLLTTSASACRRLLHKAEVMGIDTQALEVQEAHIASLVDIRKKWHIPASFTVEFIGYYLDRNIRLISMKEKLEELLKIYDKLQEEQQSLRLSYDELLQENTEENRKNVSFRQIVHKYHSTILQACPNKQLESIDDLCKPPQVNNPQVAVSQATPRAEQLLLECGICKRTVDQHLLAKCDTCHLHYHLGCLNPPLTRMPKKTKLMGWQCSECDKETSGSEVECLDPEAPRRLRHAKEGERLIDPITCSSSPEVMVISTPPQTTTTTIATTTTTLISQTTSIVSPKSTTPRVTIKPLAPNPADLELSIPVSTVTESPNIPEEANISGRPGKKRRREKHHRYSPDSSPVKEHKRKRKRKSQDMENPKDAPRIKIKIKPILPPNGEEPNGSTPQMFVASSTTESVTTNPIRSPVSQHQVVLLSNTPPATAPFKLGGDSGQIASASFDNSTSFIASNRRSSVPKKSREVDQMTKCDVCQGPGSNQNLVRCDECQKCYHFTCLDPPVKKSPKRRGYSWHCADCDPTENDSDH